MYAQLEQMHLRGWSNHLPWTASKCMSIRCTDYTFNSSTVVEKLRLVRVTGGASSCTMKRQSVLMFSGRFRGGSPAG